MIEFGFELKDLKLNQRAKSSKNVIGLGGWDLGGRHAQRSIILDGLVARLDAPALWVERDHLLVSHSFPIRDQKKLPLTVVLIEINLLAHIEGKWQSV